MKKSRFTEEQIIFALNQAELGTPVPDVCRKLETDPDNWITGCAWADRNGKEEHVARLLKEGFHVLAAGDAFNDFAMLRLAHDGFLVRPSTATVAAAQDLAVVENLSEIIEKIGFAEFPPDTGTGISRFA